MSLTNCEYSHYVTWLHDNIKIFFIFVYIITGKANVLFEYSQLINNIILFKVLYEL